MYMGTIAPASPNYDFRRDFDSITRPGLHRYLDTPADLLGNEFAERRAGCAKEYVRTVWRALKSEQEDAEIREGIEPSPPMGSPPGTPPYIHPPWNAERAAAIAAEFEADAIAAEADAIAEAAAGPVDIHRAMYLGLEMARNTNARAKVHDSAGLGPIP